MLYAAFSTVEAALEHRATHGGWVFEAEDHDEAAIWFSSDYAPTQIFTHNATRGLNGKLV